MSAPERPFDEPWQAQLFALTVALNEAGHVDWPEFGAVFAEARAGEGDYFNDWLAALQRLLAERGLADPAAVAQLTAAWQRAARATPHGQPIELGNDPEGVDG